MDFKQVKELIEMVNTSELRVFEIHMENATIKMSKNKEGNFSQQGMPAAEGVEQGFVQETREHVPQIEPKENAENTVTAGNEVKAPLVGTFYASASPDKPNFVSIGDKVKKGDVLCIVEAMKVMNEVVSEFDGEVKAVLVENESLVEYGQSLFIIG